MPPKKVTTPPSNSIVSVFAAGAKAKTTASPAVQESKQEVVLSSSDLLIAEFYASLSRNERIAHEIAVEKLGTSYDVSRTHGFVKWKKSRA